MATNRLTHHYASCKLWKAVLKIQWVFLPRASKTNACTSRLAFLSAKGKLFVSCCCLCSFFFSIIYLDWTLKVHLLASSLIRSVVAATSGSTSTWCLREFILLQRVHTLSPMLEADRFDRWNHHETVFKHHCWAVPGSQKHYSNMMTRLLKAKESVMCFCSVPNTNYNFFTSACICVWGTCINTNIFIPALLCVTASGRAV